MKKFALLIVLVCIALTACSAPPTVSTPLGKFEYSQETMASIEDDQGNSLAAATGNTLLIVYMTPDKDTNVTEDQAYSYFYNGTKATVAGQSYDLKCIALEKTGGRLRYGLVFEVVDNGYDKQKPDVSLSLPQSAPEVSAAPVEAPTVAETPLASAIPTTNPDVSPAANS